MSDSSPCNCDQALELLEALDSVLSAATEPGHQLSDTEICDAIDWRYLREIASKYRKPMAERSPSGKHGERA